MTTEQLPNGVIVCLAPGAELTDDERNTLVEYFDFLCDRKAIEAQYQGAERDAQLNELRATYEAAHAIHVAQVADEESVR